MSSIERMPGALSALWRALKRGYQAEPALLVVSFGLAMTAALPDALLALGLKILADGVLQRSRGLVVAASVALGIAAAGTWFLRVVSDRAQRRFRDRLTIALESHVANLLATLATIEHHERPQYLDRLAMLRNQVFVLDHMYMSLFTTCGWILRLGVTLALLVSVHPALGLLAVFALPTVLTSTWRPGVERAAEERGASAKRLVRHFFDLATTAPPGKEVRVTRIGPRIVERRRETAERWYRPIAAARFESALWHSGAWAVFGLAYVGAIIFVSSVLKATPGAVLLVLAAGSRLSAYVGATVGEIGFLRGIWLDGSIRLAWLEDYAASLQRDAREPVPASLKEGISIKKMSFAYPGTDRMVLDSLDLNLKPGSVVAIVGENGAGKSTLVKLLCQLYYPTSGQILVEGRDLLSMPASQWRLRIAGAFQDFFRFELPAAHSVGVGDLPRIDDESAVLAAVDRAGARDVIDDLNSGLSTQLGPTWPGGTDLSFGQWQKLALARGFMREHPLLLILDEPTAALDAETEHALFERFAAAARNERNGASTPEACDGRITILVSHRFSTVRMADFIIVLDGASVAETGTHEDLMTRNGKYAQLYTIQANAYRKTATTPREASGVAGAAADGSNRV